MGIQSKIEASIDKFTPAMQRVAAVIRDNPAIVLDMTISDLAAACAPR
ncbi:MAG: hypothetical protein MO852_03425 [Candidatus Devosia euplotis]|nr:hypothetical protein [Candidatus Devosia euplotis]